MYGSELVEADLALVIEKRFYSFEGDKIGIVLPMPTIFCFCIQNSYIISP